MIVTPEIQMEKVLTIIASALLIFVLSACSENAEVNAEQKTLKGELLEAGCSDCMYNIEGADQLGCVTAVRIDGKVYLVDGVGRKDAYSKGLCKSTHKVKVDGELRDGVFHSTSMEHMTGAHEGSEGSEGSHKH